MKVNPFAEDRRGLTRRELLGLATLTSAGLAAASAGIPEAKAAPRPGEHYEPLEDFKHDLEGSEGWVGEGGSAIRRPSTAFKRSATQTLQHASSTFFEARHRLLTNSERIAQENEIDRQVQAIRRGRSVGLLDALEEGFYWLISAAVLAYLAPGLFGLETSLCLRAPATVDVANYRAMTSGNLTIIVSNRKL